jgi:hypothetical protein
MMQTYKLGLLNFSTFQRWSDGTRETRFIECFSSTTM